METAKKKCCRDNGDPVHETRVRLLNDISQQLKKINKDVNTIKKDIDEIKTKINDDIIIEVNKKEKTKEWWY